MTERATSGRRSFRVPSVGDWIGLVVTEGLVWLFGAIAAGYTDWPPLPWITAAVMVLVLIRWVLKLRSPNDSHWGGSGEGRQGYPMTGYDGMSGGAS